MIFNFKKLDTTIITPNITMLRTANALKETFERIEGIGVHLVAGE